MYIIGDVISNGFDPRETNMYQEVLIIGDIRSNDRRGSRYDYPYLCEARHITGPYVGETVYGYNISRNSVILSRSDKLKPKCLSTKIVFE